MRGPRHNPSDNPLRFVAILCRVAYLIALTAIITPGALWASLPAQRMMPRNCGYDVDSAPACGYDSSCQQDGNTSPRILAARRSSTWRTLGSPSGAVPEFTGKERDAETGLDYFGARYFSGAQGRFTSPDEPLLDQHPEDPQSWNL